MGQAAGSRPDGWMERAILAVRERTKTLAELVDWIKPYLVEEVEYEEAASAKYLRPALVPALESLVERLQGLREFSREAIEQAFLELLEAQGLKMGQLAQPVRVALTGRAASPGIYEVMDLLGRDRTLTRLRRGIARARAARP